MPTARWPMRAPSRPPGKAVSPASNGPGAMQEAGPQDRLVPHAGEEEDAAEHQGAEAAEEGERADVGQGHGPVPDHRGLNDGVGVVPRAGHQPGAPPRRPARRRPRMRALVQPQSEPSTMAATTLATADREEDGTDAGRTGGPPGRGPRADSYRRRPSASSAEGQVDQEDPAPAGLDQQAADGRSEGGGGAADGGPQPDGRALALGPEGGEQQARARSGA